MPPRREGWIIWKPSKARQILLEDLEEGLLPVDADEMSAEEAWDIMYSNMAEFVPVVFSQFKERLRDHRKQVGEQTARSILESEALMHDRLMFPRQMENCRGEPVFDLSAAKLLLRADVADGKHLTMKPLQLKLTRDEYKPYSTKVFKHRIYQEVRREKFINYLEQRRALLHRVLSVSWSPLYYYCRRKLS
jgi:hypothetical protein